MGEEECQIRLVKVPRSRVVRGCVWDGVGDPGVEEGGEGEDDGASVDVRDEFARRREWTGEALQEPNEGEGEPVEESTPLAVPAPGPKVCETVRQDRVLIWEEWWAR